MCVWVCKREFFIQNPAQASLLSGFLLCAVRSVWLVFRSVLTALLPRLTPAPRWRLVVQHVKPLCTHVCIFCPLAALYPGLRNGLDAVVSPGDGPCHAGYGVCVPSQSQAVSYRPLQATVVLWKAFPRLQAVEDAEDGSGDWVERCNAITWGERQEMLMDKYKKGGKGNGVESDRLKYGLVTKLYI